jgi:hypothetical protein
MAAGIAQTMGLTLRIAPQHEILTQHAQLKRLLGNIGAFICRVPEIDKHAASSEFS